MRVQLGGRGVGVAQRHVADADDAIRPGLHVLGEAVVDRGGRPGRGLGLLVVGHHPGRQRFHADVDAGLGQLGLAHGLVAATRA